jgi:hypothetical protein
MPRASATAKNSAISSTHQAGFGKVQKKSETDAIFENGWEMNVLADMDPETLRSSMDTKASVNVGESSRYGRSRGLEPVKASDQANGMRLLFVTKR